METPDTVRVGGRLTVDTRDALTESAREVLRTGARTLRLDFTGTYHLDAAGVSALLALRSECAVMGRSLVLLNVGDDVGSVLDLTNTRQLFREGE